VTYRGSGAHYDRGHLKVVDFRDSDPPSAIEDCELGDLKILDDYYVAFFKSNVMMTGASLTRS
jgi:hypothetical protein